MKFSETEAGKKIWQNWVVGSITCEESIDQAYEKGQMNHIHDNGQKCWDCGKKYNDAFDDGKKNGIARGLARKDQDHNHPFGLTEKCHKFCEKCKEEGRKEAQHFHICSDCEDCNDLWNRAVHSERTRILKRLESFNHNIDWKQVIENEI